MKLILLAIYIALLLVSLWIMAVIPSLQALVGVLAACGLLVKWLIEMMKKP